MLRLACWIVLVASAVLFFTSLWILIPAPHLYLVPLGVGSPELSPGLFAAALILSVLGALNAKRLGVARLGLLLALAAASLSLLPAIQMPSTLKRFDEAISQTSFNQKGMRARPFAFSEILRAIDGGDAHVIRGVEFAKPDGVPLVLDVYQPRSHGKFPALVRLYGGAWQRGSPSDEEWFARYFASRGYVVFAISHRHAPQWRWPEQLEDVRSALIWISQHAPEFDGDPSRMILFGRSSGAQLAMRAAYQEASSSIRAVVNYYGPADLAEAWRQPPTPDPLDVRGILEAFIGGTPAQMLDRYRHASPIAYASHPVPPTLLIYGARDHIVDARFGRALHEALKKGGNTAVLLELPWSEHAFDVLPNGLGGQIALYYTERFIAWAVNR